MSDEKEFDLNNKEVRDVHADTVNMLRSGARSIRAQNVSLTQGCIQAIEADNVAVEMGCCGIIRSGSVEVEKGGVGIVNSKSVTISEGGAGIVRAARVTADRVSTVFLVADNIKGDVTTVLDKKSTLVLASVISGTLVFISFLKFLLFSSREK